MTILLKKKQHHLMVWHGDNLPWAQKMRCIQLAYSHRWCHIVGVPMLLSVVLLEKPTPLPISLENRPHWLCKCICQLFQSRRLLLNLAKHQQPFERMTKKEKKKQICIDYSMCWAHFQKAWPSWSSTYLIIWLMNPENVWRWISNHITMQNDICTIIGFHWFRLAFEHRSIWKKCILMDRIQFERSPNEDWHQNNTYS